MLISGKYQVESQIGQGSMGVVYKVRHTALDTILALKVLPSQLTDNEDLVKRFYREARVMARLNHSNIARVIDVQRDENLKFHYFVMEFIQGKTLRQYAKDMGVIRLHDVVDIGRQVARALDYAHNFKPPVIHRDIKPSNIMVEQDTRRVVVMDFGIAKEMDETEMTRAGTILGTLKYCPPEQMRHEALDGSADIYALGMVLYELIRGAHPFEGMRENEVIRAVLDATEYELTFPPDVVPAFCGLVKKALTKNRGARYQRMSELLRDLDKCAQELNEGGRQNVVSRPITDAHDGDDLTHIEEQIHKLEEERLRRKVLQAQARVKVAKEAATQEGATEFSAQLFGQACDHESLARTNYQNRHYLEAQSDFDTAFQMFDQAREQASSVSIARNADRAREEVAAARREADQYGAHQRSLKAYGLAVDVLARADSYWETQSYREAYEAYGEARHLFESAQESAYRAVLEDETREIVRRLHAARALAEEAESEEFAADVFFEAMRLERRGDAAVEQSEFTQAQELYLHSLESYGQAQKTAVRERKHRRALDAQAESRRLRQQAENQGASEDLESFLDGAAHFAKAERDLLTGGYDQAADAYALASAAFQQAYDEAVLSQQQRHLTELRQEVENRQVELQRVAEDATAAAELEDLRKMLLEAQSRAETGDLEDGISGYKTVLERIEKLSDVTTQRLVTRRVDEARTRLDALRAGQDRGQPLGQRQLLAVDKLAEQGRKALEDGKLDRAAELYEQAAQTFEDTIKRHQDDAQRQSLLTALAEANAAHKDADRANAKAGAARLYADGVAALRNGDQAFKDQRWTEAADCFDSATRHLRLAADEAQRATRTKSVVKAQTLAREARTKAESVGAPAAKPDAFKAALKTLESAELRLQTNSLADAETQFHEAATVLDGLCQDVTRQRLEKQAGLARADALQASARVPATAPGNGKLLRKAQKVLAQADQLFERTKYAEAEKSYLDATELFSRLTAGKAPTVAARTSANTARGMNLSWPVLAIVGLLTGGGIGLGVYYWQLPTEVLRDSVGDIGVTGSPEAGGATYGSGISSATPPLTEDVIIAEGQSQPFSVAAASSLKAPLAYHWTLDGIVVDSAESRWIYTPDFDAAATKPKEVKVTIIDSGRHSAAHVWKVSVLNVNRGPRIETVIPTDENLSIVAGDIKEFSVNGSDPDRDDVLTYRWYDNGKEVAQGRILRFEPKTAGEMHNITVEVSDRAGLTVRNAWNIKITATSNAARPAGLEVSPQPGELPIEVKLGATKTFAAKVVSPDDAATRLQWHLDGVKVSDANEWAFAPTTLGSGDRHLVLTTKERNAVSRKFKWTLRVVGDNAAPVFAKISPASEAPLIVAPSGVVHFAVTATDADAPAKKLDYRWLVDGTVVAQSPEWRFQARRGPDSSRHEIAVQVVDTGGASISKSWLVVVADPRVRPRVATARPGASKLAVGVGETVKFHVDAGNVAVSGEDYARMRYLWRINRGSGNLGNSADFVWQPQAAGRVQISVVLVDQHGLRSVPQTWFVDVAEKKSHKSIAELATSGVVGVAAALS